MPNCRKCGGPLYVGNVQVVRKPGKRPRREHRKCPEVRTFVAPTTPDGKIEHWIDQGTADGPQRSQDNTGGPWTVEGIWSVKLPRNRFFMTQDQAERIKASIDRNLPGFGISFEVIPVPEEEVEREPDRYAELVEVMVNWKVEN